MNSGVVRIAKKVVHAIGVHLAGDQITPEDLMSRGRAALQQRGDIVGAESVIALIQFVIFNDRLQRSAHDCSRILLVNVFPAAVLVRKKLLGCVGKGRMADIMK